MEQWLMKPGIYSGTDSLDRLAQFDNEKIIVVCDPFLKDSKTLTSILSHLKASNSYFVFADIIPEPPIETVTQGLAKMTEEEPTVMIAIGGGSSIDTAKAMSFFHEKMTGKKMKKFVAIPTTSGTGSEVTSYAVITDSRDKIKYPVATDALVPDEALLDEKLVVSSPASVTAASGLDVLTHGLEALIATNHDNYSDAFANQAIRLVFAHLVNCVDEPTNVAERHEMHEASCLAGLAFNHAGVGICHSIAHQVGAQFHVPHGLANSMLLPYVVKENAENDPEALCIYANLAKELGFCSRQMSNKMAIEMLSKEIARLAHDCHVVNNLKDFGVDVQLANEKADEIAANAIKDSTYATNPVKFSQDDLKAIYEKIIQ